VLGARFDLKDRKKNRPLAKASAHGEAAVKTQPIKLWPIIGRKELLKKLPKSSLLFGDAVRRYAGRKKRLKPGGRQDCQLTGFSFFFISPNDTAAGIASP
jgi:hypothetical protein